MADVPIVFVNSLTVSGFQNGVLNLSFSTAPFLPLPPDPDGKVKVSTQEIITANLRMDLFCAQQVHGAIGKILADQAPPTAKGDLN